MTISLWRRGAAIPAAGDPIVVPVCLPDTWTPILRGLLVNPTKPYFWDNTASPEAIEAAVNIAHGIVASFDTPDCTCEPECGAIQSMEFDWFTTDGGWTATDGVWTSGTGWQSVEEIRADGKHAVLNIWWEATTPLYTNQMASIEWTAVFGVGAGAAIAIDVRAYNDNIGTIHHWRYEGHIEAQAGSQTVEENGDYNVYNPCLTPTNSYSISVDIGPYDNLYQTGFDAAGFRIVYKEPV